MDAFQELSTTRSIGFAEGPIPWTAIERYADRHGFTDPDEFETFRRLMRAMDAAYFKASNKPATAPKPA